MKRLLVNDALSQLGERTFWHDLQEWFGCEFVGAPYANLVDTADAASEEASLIIRNATYFGPLDASKTVPTISLLQDISLDGEIRKMQEAVIKSSTLVVFNSEYTARHYSKVPAPTTRDGRNFITDTSRVIPLPVDFSLFEPQNSMGCQQALSLPDGCVCWIGACREAGHVKGWDVFLQVVRHSPDIPFVGVFKDTPPEYAPPNLRMFSRLPHERLVEVIGACRVGLCTSRMESQHLAGIEMGACGLPMVAPPVGVYYDRKDDFPGFVMKEGATPEHYATAIRLCMTKPIDLLKVRGYWQKEFDKPVIKAAWTKLVEEVECSGQS
jgi:glycosyltransferase involved in cell wall biosynthesis